MQFDHLIHWVVRIGQDVAEARLPGCTITFARGPADRITAVVLTGRGAPADR